MTVIYIFNKLHRVSPLQGTEPFGLGGLAAKPPAEPFGLGRLPSRPFDQVIPNVVLPSPSGSAGGGAATEPFGLGGRWSR